MKKLNHILHSKIFFGSLICFIFFYIFFSFLFQKSIYSNHDHLFLGTILSKKIDGNMVTLEIKAKEKLIVYYYAKTEADLKKIVPFDLGDQILVSGNLSRPSKNRNFALFNYQSYLKGKKIFWILNADKIILKKKATGLYILKNKIIERIEKQKSADYLFAFLLGDSSKIQFKTKFQELGISHLFAVSGMHILFLTAFLFFLCDHFFKNKIHGFIIITFFLGVYTWLLYDSASANRAYLLFALSFLNKHYKWGYRSLELLFLVFVILTIKNPFCILQVGFQFSFIICFFLMLQKFNPSSYLKSLFFTSLLASAVSFPLSVYHFHQFHFGSVFFNLIAVPFVSFLLFPFSFLSFFLPIFNPFLHFFIQIFHFIIDFFTSFSFMKLSFCAFPIYILILYYIILCIAFMISKKYLFLFMIFVFIHFNFPYLDSHYWIDMIDVGQADSILIRYPHLKRVILVDTGGKISYETEAWKQRKTKSEVDHILIPYFKSLGITKIDVLILTHGDQDHIGNAKELISKFPVSKVFMNSGNKTNIEVELINQLKENNISFSNISTEKIKIGNHLFLFLNSTDLQNENEDSLVFYTKLKNRNILFMGDAGEKTENKILKEYKLPKMHILKVGHHGSKTSTSSSFLNQISPKISLISAGKDNKFGHPNHEVIDALKKNQSDIFVTKEVGAIRLKLGRKIEVMTCL